jgi:hypothetical protein
MRKISTKLLAISITTAAIIAAVTTTSLSAASPAFAKFDCNETETGVVCSGGSSGPDRPGGFGGRIALDEDSGTITRSGGSGENTGAFVGGGAGHSICDLTGCTERGGSGQHEKGPGGNSGSVPP